MALNASGTYALVRTTAWLFLGLVYTFGMLIALAP